MPLPITLFFTAVAGFLAWQAGRWFWTALRGTFRSLRWNTTSGVVTRLEIINDYPFSEARRPRRVEALVAYTVADTEYATAQISALGDPRELYYRGRTLRRIRSHLATGRRVSVRYNPRQPGEAVLLWPEWGKLLTLGMVTLIVSMATAGILVMGLTIMEPVRARETKALHVLRVNAPPGVEAHLRAHPELGRLQEANGFWEGGPHDTPPTGFDGDWEYLVRTTKDTYALRAVNGRIVEVRVWENPGDPRWLRDLRRSTGLWWLPTP